MDRNIIKKYASNITKNDILNFSRKENINISNEEVNIIHNSIINDQDKILNNFYEYMDNYKDKLNPILFNKIIEIYQKYKKFID